MGDGLLFLVGFGVASIALGLAALLFSSRSRRDDR
jgi:hypothetical protein